MPAIKLASIAVAIALGRRLLLSVSDPRTARLTHRMGFSIYQVGPVMEYHGSRAAYRIDVDEVVSGMTLDAQDHLHQLVDAAKRRLTGLNSQGGDGTWCL